MNKPVSGIASTSAAAVQSRGGNISSETRSNIEAAIKDIVSRTGVEVEKVWLIPDLSASPEQVAALKNAFAILAEAGVPMVVSSVVKQTEVAVAKEGVAAKFKLETYESPHGRGVRFT